MSNNNRSSVTRERGGPAFLGRLLSVLVCGGVLAACGGGGGGGGGDGPLPAVKEVAESQFMDTESGRMVSGYLEAFAAEGVSLADVKAFVARSGWKIVGYVEAARLFQIDTGVTGYAGLAAARDKAISSGYFGSDVYYVRPVGVGAAPSDAGLNAVETSWNYDAASIKTAWNFMNDSERQFSPVQIAVADQGFTTTTAAPDLELDQVVATCDAHCEDHGYHVAGIIGASANKDGIVGIPNAVLRAVVNGGGGQNSTSVEDALTKLVQLEPRVINISMGNYEAPNDGRGVISNETYKKIWDLEAAFSGAYATLWRKLLDSNAGQGKYTDILIVQASGNAGGWTYNGAPIHSELNGFATNPNTSDSWIKTNIYEKSLIVGAYDKDKKVADYTQLPRSGQAKANFILAPGDAIYSTTPSGLTKKSGTSMAAPHVSGVAALVWMMNPRLSAKQVRDLILEHCDFIEHNGETYRALNAEKAVRAAQPKKPTATVTVITPKPTAEAEVTFRVVLGSSPNGVVDQYEWDFGDGSAPVLSGVASEFRHTYSAPGNYAVKLKIKDVLGVTNTIDTSVSIAGAVAETLGAESILTGAYYDYVDYGPNKKCYYKTSGSLVSPRTYAITEEDYCLESGQWKRQVHSGTSVVLSAEGAWIEQRPQVVVSGDSTFSVRYGGSEFYTGTLSASGNGGITQVLTPTRSIYRIHASVEDNYYYQNVSSLAQLIDGWNNSLWNFTTGSGPWVDSNSARYKFFFVGGGQDPHGFIKIIDITGVPPALADETIWSRASLGGSDAIVLGPKSTLVSERAGVQKFYIKRPGRTGVEEGDLEQPGFSTSIQSMTKSGMNRYLGGLGLPAVAN